MSKDWVSLKDAVVTFRGNVAVMGRHVEAIAAHSSATQLEIVAEGYVLPAWGASWRADMRLLEAGKPVLERVLVGWVAPDLEAVSAVNLDDRELEREFQQSRQAFIEAAGRVAARYAAHGDVFPRTLEDQTHFRRVAPGSWPAEAAELVPEAQAALSRWALAWLTMAGRADGASFLPRRTA